MIEDNCEVFYDMWNSFEIFNAMSTQWNTGYSGPVGLRYEAIREVCTFFDITEQEEIKEIFHDIRLMEATALKIMHKEKK